MLSWENEHDANYLSSETLNMEAYMREYTRVWAWEYFRDSYGVEQFLYKWTPLHSDCNGILRHKEASGTQLVLPRQYKELVYKQLDEEMT